ncbi:hypothetical protein SRB5_63700 [Streptomyces sp. RB5]|uniref:Type VII secretion protein EccB n=1 Tax=Streptomyces smaragdinus TaxID=2585196 RepID=A0A7K0CTY3_9ACTN|nr:type VII secretion protein EccB [Streptomyces smaragdinus]MQY16174.1 hypothetical protein [Streptomyces smaragdinus]
MASRRDELNAYTFAKRRLVGQFLQPNPTGTEEGAPKPLRGVLPGMIIAVVILAVFGAIGMFKPKAPKDWDAAEKNIIRVSDSSTFYVVLRTNKKPQLHEVLNLASARLLLRPGADIIDVDEDILDASKLPRGATLGIQNAPDRLPSAEEVGKKKRWAVCQRSTDGARAVQKAAYVLSAADSGRVGGKDKLTGGEVLFVQGPDDKLYIVDRQGTKYAFPDGPDQQGLVQLIIGNDTRPQRVTTEWLATLHTGDPIEFPQVEGLGGPTQAAGVDNLENNERRVGMVLSASSGATTRQFVVLTDRVAPVSDFTAYLLLNSPQAVALDTKGKAAEVSSGSFTAGEPYGTEYNWPEDKASAVNEAALEEGNRNVICNVLDEVTGSNATKLFTWAGTDLPAPLAIGSPSYVSPGSGQLYRQSSGASASTGSTFLVTDKGLRYAVQSNQDSQEGFCGVGTDDAARQKNKAEAEENTSQKRLNYDTVQPKPIPGEWSDFLPTGPRLSTADACQPQNL